ncbi:MAG TPA: fatty acid oxidation complex subunit alpha FadJ [Gemmatimonadales bacterium]|jgi:3-hydroxyacyl-CoA dehydrogenase/enoyl-CoA hydratase/3-hydroxybutyryl-CoA epimerase
MPAFTLSSTDGIAVLTLDVPGEPVNALGSTVVGEFEALLARIESDASLRAVVLLSGKPDSFIAGADIQEFVRITTAAEGEALARAGQEMINRIARFPKPIVIAIHGACVGLGCELALACAWRIATDSPKTVIGLPEVQIGILPGAGGCQRLPRLIGVRAALDIILAGKSERAAKAFKLGLVDELVPPSILRGTALAAADRLARHGGGDRPKRGSLLLERNPLGRRLVYSQARKQVRKKTGGNYPAPLAALEAVQRGMEHGMEAGLRREAQLFGELAVGEVSRNLVRIFFATNALKKDFGVPEGSARPDPVRRLGIIGAGFMGSGIAGTAVTQAGVEARLKDAELARVGKGLKAAIEIVRGQLTRRRISRHEFEREVALLTGATDWRGFERADLVIEAVFEDLAVKRRVMREAEEVLRPGVVLASNTSTIPIASIAEGARHPERILGMHFFSPVERMPLLEVIPTTLTAPRAIATAVQFGRRMGKTAIVVADRPGFWVNRILSPYLNEAGLLLAEGAPIEVIDRAMTRFGFPVGPIALLDEVGLDVAQKASGVMHGAFGERMTPGPGVAAMVQAGRLGRKSGKGFYLYHDGHKTEPDPSVYKLLGVTPLATVQWEGIERRLVYILLNEAALAVAEGVVRSPRDGDLGAIYGIGYPPFRGGPLRYTDYLGAGEVVRALEALALAYGPRFTPAPSLLEMARNGAKFYPD